MGTTINTDKTAPRPADAGLTKAVATPAKPTVSGSQARQNAEAAFDTAFAVAASLTAQVTADPELGAAATAGATEEGLVALRSLADEFMKEPPSGALAGAFVPGFEPSTEGVSFATADPPFFAADEAPPQPSKEPALDQAYDRYWQR